MYSCVDPLFGLHTSLVVLYIANKHTGEMDNLKPCIEQLIYPRPVLNTELNIDHSHNAAFRFGQKIGKRRENAVN
ncbi:hypothetical protein OUHCRE12_29210 [Enterobacter kobei]